MSLAILDSLIMSPSPLDKTIAELRRKCAPMPKGFVLTYDDASAWFANRGMACGRSGRANREFMAALVKCGMVPKP